MQILRISVSAALDVILKNVSNDKEISSSFLMEISNFFVEMALREMRLQSHVALQFSSIFSVTALSF